MQSFSYMISYMFNRKTKTSFNGTEYIFPLGIIVRSVVITLIISNDTAVKEDDNLISVLFNFALTVAGVTIFLTPILLFLEVFIEIVFRRLFKISIRLTKEDLFRKNHKCYKVKFGDGEQIMFKEIRKELTNDSTEDSIINIDGSERYFSDVSLNRSVIEHNEISCKDIWRRF